MSVITDVTLFFKFSNTLFHPYPSPPTKSMDQRSRKLWLSLTAAEALKEQMSCQDVAVHNHIKKL